MPILRGNGVFCVNTLRAGDEIVADTSRAAPRWRARRASTPATSWMTLATGSPVLNSAVVACDCRVIEVKAVASHDIYFGMVEAIHQARRAPRWSITIGFTSRFKQLAFTAPAFVSVGLSVQRGLRRRGLASIQSPKDS